MSSAKPSPAAQKNSSKKIDLTQGEWSNQRHSVEATAKEGYMCHITMNAQLDLTPEQMFAIFTHPDNSHIFRDLGRTVKYKVVDESDDGVHQTVEIEQQAVFKFLAIPVKFSTKLLVYVDFQRLTMSFKLARWGTMRKFEGQWEMEPLLGEDGQVVGTKARLTQDVLPLIVPPLLKGFLSGVSANVVRRLLEDLEVVGRRVAEGENLSKILGDTKWMEVNPMLQEWRQKMEAQWEQRGNQGSGSSGEKGGLGGGPNGEGTPREADGPAAQDNDMGCDGECHRGGNAAELGSSESGKMDAATCEESCCAGTGETNVGGCEKEVVGNPNKAHQGQEACSADRRGSQERSKPESNSVGLET